MAASSTITLAALGAAVVYVGNRPLDIQAKALDADGLPSGAVVRLSSSDRGIAEVTTAEQLGNAPAGVRGIAAGTATITATPADNSGISATLVVTVT